MIGRTGGLDKGAEAFELVVAGVTEEVIAVVEDNEGGASRLFVFPVGESEEVLLIECDAQPFRETVSDGALKLCVAHIDTSKEGLFAHNRFLCLKL